MADPPPLPDCKTNRQPCFSSQIVNKNWRKSERILGFNNLGSKREREDLEREREIEFGVDLGFYREKKNKKWLKPSGRESSEHINVKITTHI